jgi:uncharacterized protein YjgD (DUF1641 family)
MGSTQSINTTDALNDIALQVINDQTNKCLTSASQTQINRFNNIKGNVNITGNVIRQVNSLNTQCLIQALQSNELQIKLATELVNKAETFGNILTLGNNKAEAITNVQNSIKQSVQNNLNNNSITSTLQNQGFDVANVDGNLLFSNNFQEQGNTIVAKNILSSSQISNVINNISKSIDQATSSTTRGPLDSLYKTLFGSSSAIIILIIICIVVCALLCSSSSALLLWSNTKQT